MSKYFVSPQVAIELNEDGTINPEDLEIALMAATGHEPSVVEGVNVWANGDHRFWLMHEQNLPQDEKERQDAIQAICQKTNARALQPTLDHSFAQSLIRMAPMNIVGESFVNGTLEGVWRVEHVTQFNPYDINVHGILTGKMQHIQVRAQSLPLAVSLLFLQIIGMSQVAYVVIPEEVSAEPKLLFVTKATEERLLKALPRTALFRAEKLDKYAIIGVDEDTIKDAIEKAQLQRTILLGELKAAANTPAPAQEPQLVDPAQETTPQQGAEAGPVATKDEGVMVPDVNLAEPASAPMPEEV